MPQEVLAMAEKPFTAKEKELLSQISRPNAKIEVVVPESIDPKEWASATNLVCRVLVRAEIQRDMLMPVLGRLLVIARENPQIYRDNGFEGFENFISSEVREKWGVSRSTCYESMRLADFFLKAGLTPDEFKEIGRVKARKLISAVPEGEESKASTRKLIEKAKELPAAEFEEHVMHKTAQEKGATIGAFIRIATNAAIAKRWKNFCDDPDIQATAGSGSPDKILDRMMEEVKAEWKAKSQEAAQATKEES